MTTIPRDQLGFVVGRDGGIVGAYAGPAEWDDPEPRALIEYYLDRPEQAAAERTGG